MVTDLCARNPVPDVDRSLRQGYSGCRLVARYCKIILAVGLSLSLGLHWCLLQSVAWASMLVERTHEASFTEAVQTTFDGQHPCKLCRIVREGQQAEKKSDRQFKVQKLETGSWKRVDFEVVPPLSEAGAEASVSVLLARAETPPLPPPRRV